MSRTWEVTCDMRDCPAREKQDIQADNGGLPRGWEEWQPRNQVEKELMGVGAYMIVLCPEHALAGNLAVAQVSTTGVPVDGSQLADTHWAERMARRERGPAGE